MVSADELQKLWRDPKFSGSFSGISNFQSALKFEKNINLSKNQIYAMLKTDRNFVLEMSKIKKRIPRRPMNVHGYGILWQADLGQLFPFKKFIYFLLCIDIFSRKIFCRPLESKRAVEVEKAFNSIFTEANIKPEKIETDSGSEFHNNRNFFEEHNIFLKIKVGANKARYVLSYSVQENSYCLSLFLSFAEHGILLVKTRLYRLMRTLLTQNWPKYLPAVVAAINNSPNVAIGGLRPSSIKSAMDDPKIDAKIGYHDDVPVEVQKKNQKEYEKKKNKLQVGNYVFLDFVPSAFTKSFDAKRSQIFRIIRIDAGKQPELYKLEDLNHEKVKGYYYASQLKKTERPKKGEFFKVEKILKEEMRRGEPYIFVQYSHYGPKFNRWIKKSNLLRNE